MVIKVCPTSRNGESPRYYHWNGNSYGIGKVLGMVTVLGMVIVQGMVNIIAKDGVDSRHGKRHGHADIVRNFFFENC